MEKLKRCIICGMASRDSVSKNKFRSLQHRDNTHLQTSITILEKVSKVCISSRGAYVCAFGKRKTPDRCLQRLFKFQELTEEYNKLCNEIIGLVKNEVHNWDTGSILPDVQNETSISTETLQNSTTMQTREFDPASTTLQTRECEPASATIQTQECESAIVSSDVKNEMVEDLEQFCEVGSDQEMLETKSEEDEQEGNNLSNQALSFRENSSIPITPLTGIFPSSETVQVDIVEEETDNGGDIVEHVMVGEGDDDVMDNGGDIVKDDMDIVNHVMVVPLAGTRAPLKDPKSRLVGGFEVHVKNRLYSVSGKGKKKIIQRKCRVCIRNGQRMDTTYYCKSCNVPLCNLKCFEKYHTHENYY